MFAMSWTEGRGQPMVLCAVSMTLWSAFLSAADHPAYCEAVCQNTLLQSGRRLPAALHISCFHLELAGCADAAVVLVDQERLSYMWIPRNLKLELFLLVFFVFSDRLLSEHHCDSFWTSSR